jgi:hypothetical protein
MRAILMAMVAATLTMMAAGPPPARALGVEADQAQRGQVVVEKRKSCWRTNRSTGTKFRIC